jgi:hypothetical protein
VAGRRSSGAGRVQKVRRTVVAGENAILFLTAIGARHRGLLYTIKKKCKVQSCIHHPNLCGPKNFMGQAG